MATKIKCKGCGEDHVQRAKGYCGRCYTKQYRVGKDFSAKTWRKVRPNYFETIPKV